MKLLLSYESLNKQLFVTCPFSKLISMLRYLEHGSNLPSQLAEGFISCLSLRNGSRGELTAL